MFIGNKKCRIYAACGVSQTPKGLYMSEVIKADNEYKEWIAGISTDFRKSQIKASIKQ